jgi:transposase
MTELRDKIDFVIGVDTHRDSYTAACLDTNGGLISHLTVPSDAFGHKKLLSFAIRYASGRRLWAVEGTGSYGATLLVHLLEQGEWVAEMDRPRRPARKNGAKSDEIDAVLAAREALSRRHLAQPRRRGKREAIRVMLTTRESAVLSRTRSICHLKATVVSAPEGLRNALRKLSTDDLLLRASRLRTNTAQSAEHRATVMALRACARRALALEAEANDLESQIELLVKQLAPQLLAEPGVGVISAAQILCSWSHPGRIRSEAAFASLAGASPIPASSGQTVRHRLNRGGDRQLNRALHTIVLSRLAIHDETKAYAARRVQEGKTPREIKRCLKRYLARRIFRLLEGASQAA